ncbi:MAG: flagellar protein FlgN [Methylococcaceae bacterium]|nr:flagellar protein FlgN [Methylococcaceae bacterium]
MIEKTYPIAEKLIFDALLLAQQLNEQLHQEAHALKKPQQPETIIVIAAYKKQLVCKLEQFSDHLGRVLATENLPNSRQGIADYFQRAEMANLTTLDAKNNWESIKRISVESKILNEQNGASLDLLARHTTRSLQILKGKSLFANTYGRDGITKNDSYRRSLVVA